MIRAALRRVGWAIAGALVVPPFVLAMLVAFVVAAAEDGWDAGHALYRRWSESES